MTVFVYRLTLQRLMELNVMSVNTVYRESVSLKVMSTLN